MKQYLTTELLLFIPNKKIDYHTNRCTVSYWYRLRLQSNGQNLFSSLYKMVKTVVIHTKRDSLYLFFDHQCLLTPHLIKHVLKVVPKINFLKTGHLNFVKKKKNQAILLLWNIQMSISTMHFPEI